MDPIDKMLQGDDPAQATPSQKSDQPVAPHVPTEEEVEFNKLSGSTQDRIRELIRERNEAKQSVQPPVYQPPQNQLTMDQKTALATLSQYGISTDEKVKREVNSAKDEILATLQTQNLMQKYAGSDGLPKYDPTDVEDYVRKHPDYATTPRELVFKAVMYPDEFSAQQPQQPSSRPSSFKPVKAQNRQDSLTPEYIEERLKQEDGDEWYDANKDEINKVVYNHTQQFKGVNFGGQ